MKTLQLKIYNTLLGKQSIQAFEEWLYNQEAILNQLEDDPFLYTIVSMNYQLKNSLSLLEKEAVKEYGIEFKTILSVEKSCLKIVKVTNLEACSRILNELVWSYSYESKYVLFWKLYVFCNNIDSLFVGFGSCEESELLIKIKNFVQKTLDKLQIPTSFEEKKTIIFEKRIPYRKKIEYNTLKQDSTIKEKTPLRKKIAHFFTSFVKVH